MNNRVQTHILWAMMLIVVASLSFNAGEKTAAWKGISSTKPTSDADGTVAVQERVKEWSLYENAEFGFNIAYPKNLDVQVISPGAPSPKRDADMRVLGDVAFVGEFGNGVMGVRVYQKPENMTHIAAWLRAHTDNIQQEAIRSIAEKPAALMYSIGSGPGDFEAFPYSKRAYLVSEDKVYEIVTSHFSYPKDYEYVWDSFSLTPEASKNARDESK